MSKKNGATLGDLLRRSDPEMMKALKDLNRGAGQDRRVESPPPVPLQARATPPPTDQGRKAIRKLKQKAPQKEVIRLPKSVADEMRRQFGQAEEPPSAPVLTPAKPIACDAMGIVARSIRGAAKSISEGAARSISADSKSEIDGRLKAGLDFTKRNNWFDPDGPVVGIDFGTSSTKAVVRWPYRADSPAFALSVPAELRLSVIGSLWQTSIWIDANGRFYLYPIEGSDGVQGFKAALIEGLAEQDCAEGVSYAHAAVAFLGLYLRQLIGDLSSTDRGYPSAGISGLNVAIPVANFDGPEAALFQRVVEAAIRVSMWEGQVDTNAVKALYDSNQPIDIGVAPGLFAELQAAVAGYAQSKVRHVGPSLIIDCGAATLDIATFNLVLLDDVPRASVFEAGVAMLGAEAFRWASDGGCLRENFLAACHVHEKSVYGPTADHRYPQGFNPAAKQRDVQVLTIGGGMQGKIHQEFVRSFSSFYGRTLITPEPRDLVCEPGTDRSRLLVADGLASDVAELPDLRAPSVISDNKASKIDYSDRYIDN